MAKQIVFIYSSTWKGILHNRKMGIYSTYTYDEGIYKTNLYMQESIYRKYIPHVIHTHTHTLKHCTQRYFMSCCNNLMYRESVKGMKKNCERGRLVHFNIIYICSLTKTLFIVDIFWLCMLYFTLMYFV